MFSNIINLVAGSHTSLFVFLAVGAVVSFLALTIAPSGRHTCR